MRYLFYALILLAFATTQSPARDLTGKYQNSPHKEWFKSQHNEKGDWCCDESDGHAYYGDYQLNDDGSVTLKLEGGDHLIPAYMVLKGSNPTGTAVWWHTSSRDYCFSPGSLT